MERKMAKRGENIYKRKDGRWEARVIKGYNEHGKALYACFYGRTYKEAKDKIFMSMPFVKNDTVHAQLQKEQVSLLKDTLDLWLENKKVGLKESSYSKYFNLISKHIKPSLGEHKLTDLSNTILNSYVTKKYNGDNQNGVVGLSEKTIKDITTIIKSTLRFAQSEGLACPLSGSIFQYSTLYQ